VTRSTRASRKAATLFSTRRHSWQLPPAWSLRADFVRLTADEDWKGLRAFGRRCVADGEHALRRIVDAERHLGLAADATNLPKEVRKALPGSLGDLPVWAQYRKDIADRLKDHGASPAAINRFVELLARTSGSGMVDEAARALTTKIGEGEGDAAHAVSTLVAGHFAVAGAIFNQEFASPTSGGEELDRKSLRAISRTTSKRLTLVHSIGADEGLAAASAAALLLGSVAQTTLPALARYAGSTARERRHGSNSDLDQLGIDIANELQKALFAIAVSHTLELAASLPRSSRTRHRWEQALQLPLHPHQNEKSISVGNALQQTGSDSRVSVRAVVENVKIVHKAKGKVVSTAALRDRSGHRVNATLEFIKLDSCGLVAGASSIVTGRMVGQGSGRALRIARRNLAKLRKTDWLSWLEAELEQTFRPVSHGLEIQFSWEPGVDGALNPLSYGVWNDMPHHEEGE
jgi:hypothetical protein